MNRWWIYQNERFPLEGERVVVIERGGPAPDDVLRVLQRFHIASVIAIPKLPMDKRHGAKLDYRKLLTRLPTSMP